MFENKKVCEIATTLDDSFGESFDKVSKMLGFGYPGGPIIEKLAQNGEDIVNLPVPMKNSNRLSFSFSGLKNAVRLAIESEKFKKEDIAKSFQNRAIEHLEMISKRVLKKYKPKNFAIVGGASANKELRKRFENLAKEFNFNLLYPKMEYTADNAAMIARAAIEKYKNKEFSDLDLEVRPRSDFDKCEEKSIIT
jgi:N6-L-threonylcarbamoyladenine synthase